MNQEDMEKKIELLTNEKEELKESNEKNKEKIRLLEASFNAVVEAQELIRSKIVDSVTHTTKLLDKMKILK